MMWELKRAMNNHSMNALEAGISWLQPWRASKPAKTHGICHSKIFYYSILALGGSKGLISFYSSPGS
jgi:hypothetical protein